MGSLLARPLNALGRAAPGRVRSFGMDVAPSDFAGATSRVLRAPRRFDIVGVRGAHAVGLEVRARSDARLLLVLAPWPGEGHPGARDAW